MARKRMIDPSLWSDDGFAELTPRQKVLYIGLFSVADDEGKLKGSPTAIALALPAVYMGTALDQIAADVDAVIARMSKIERYSVKGAVYLRFANYERWQRIDRPSPSDLPDPDSGAIVERSTNDQEPLGDDSSLIEVKLKEVNGIEKNIEASPYTLDFENWWKTWPKKGDTKSKAFTAWGKLNAARRRLATGGLPKWLPYYASIENRIIPDAATWLNQARWENDPPPIEATNGKHIPARDNVMTGDGGWFEDSEDNPFRGKVVRA